MWQGIRVISDYKPTNPSPPSPDTYFLNELNNFYTCFERDNHAPAIKAELAVDHQPLILATIDVKVVLSRINAHKAAGPDGIPGHGLRACAGELPGVLTDLFNLSLAHAVVPTCFKSTTIMPHRLPSSGSHPIISKCLEQLVLAHLTFCL